MKNILLLTLILFFGNLFSQNSIWIRLQNVPEFKSGNLTSQDIILNKKLSQYQITNIKRAVPVAKSEKLSTIWEISCDCDANELVKSINTDRSRDLAYLAPNYTPLYTPNDYSLTTGSDWALNLIGAQSAWQITQGSPNFVIGVSDQNIDPNHEELVGKIINFDSTNTGTTTHGTAVAIVAAGNTNNGVGLSSIGFRSSIAFYPMNYNGLLQAAYDGVDVINISWSSGCFYNQYEKDIVDEVWSLGTFLVAAAGNGNTCGWAGANVYPASYPVVFSVSSIGESDNHEQWPGDTLSTHQHNSSVDLVAPGYSVPISPAQGWYLQSSGTSFAAPFVTGTIALMLTKNPCLTNSDIQSILKSTSQNIYHNNPQYIGLLGSGRLNSEAAVLAAANFITPANLNLNQSWQSTYGEISITPTGLQQPFLVQWSSGHTGLENSNLPTGQYQIILTDAHGCQIDTNVTLNEVVDPIDVDTLPELVDNPQDFDTESMLEITQNEISDVLVFPNPSQSQITISSEHNIEFCEVYDTEGKMIMSNQFELLNLPTGVYIIKIQTAKGQSVKRVVFL